VAQATFFDPALALVDFRRAPLPPRAEELDNAQMLAARYAGLDAVEYFAPRVMFQERLYGSTVARMNDEPLHLAASEPEVQLV
jgi:hypothetical protein